MLCHESEKGIIYTYMKELLIHYRQIQIYMYNFEKLIHFLICNTLLKQYNCLSLQAVNIAPVKSFDFANSIAPVNSFGLTNCAYFTSDFLFDFTSS